MGVGSSSSVQSQHSLISRLRKLPSHLSRANASHLLWSDLLRARLGDVLYIKIDGSPSGDPEPPVLATLVKKGKTMTMQSDGATWTLYKAGNHAVVTNAAYRILVHK